MEQGIHIQSSAKINLFLEVLGKRPDGYHDLETLFQEISLCDDLHIQISRNKRIEIETDSLDIPTGSTNLVYRAAEAFLKKAGIQRGLNIKINKRIPVGGGLGGGSSNAAATLKGLQQLFSVSLDPEECLDICKGLGADVAFFLIGKTAVGRGIGEKLEPVQKRDSFFVLLVNPGFKISTAQVYQSLKTGLIGRSHSVDRVKRALEQGDLETLGKNLFNRLEEPVFQNFPQLIKIKDRLKEGGCRGALLSGSGSTLFGIARDKGTLVKIQKILAPSFWTTVCQAL